MKFIPFVVSIGLLSISSASAQIPASDLQRAGLVGPVYAVSSTTKVHFKTEGQSYDSTHVTEYYDRNGNLTFKLWYYENALVARKTLYRPDNNDLIEKVERLKPINHQFDPPPPISVHIIRYNFKYGDTGRILAETITYEDGSTLELKHEYDAEGRLKPKVTKQITGHSISRKISDLAPLETAPPVILRYHAMVSAETSTTGADSHGNWRNETIGYGQDAPFEESVERTITYYSPETGEGQPITGERPDDAIEPMTGPPQMVPNYQILDGGMKAAYNVYPAYARAAHLSGRVVVEFLVDENGHVISAAGLSGPRDLRRAAVNTIKQKTFTPAELNGVPVRVLRSTEIDFNM